MIFGVAMVGVRVAVGDMVCARIFGASVLEALLICFFLSMNQSVCSLI